jgi:Na+-translocating ferredoxin:NAD+ oxidoreductase RnfD subunit
MDVVPGRWGGSVWAMPWVAILGFLIAIRVKRLDLCLSWLGTFLIIAVLRSLISGWPFITTIAPATGAAFMLLTFFMITDPMTTPSSSTTRVLFGITLGILDGILRYFQVINSPLYALFILCAFSGTLYAAGNLEKENIFRWNFLELGHPAGKNQGK